MRFQVEEKRSLYMPCILSQLIQVRVFLKRRLRREWR